MARTVEQHLADWAAQAPDICRVSAAEWAFIADMRKAAASGVGYGWMQQQIEREWNARVSHGGWGPEYFRAQIDELEAALVEANATIEALRGAHRKSNGPEST